MILKRFRRPKWQHPNPENRRQAVDSLQDPTILAEIALSDSDPAVRRLACKKLSSLSTLAEVAALDGDAGVREFVRARRRSLLCGKEVDSPPLEERLTHLASLEPGGLLDQVALRGKEPELRCVALEKLQTAGVLAEIAVRDSAAGNRLRAAERLDDREALEWVLHKIGRKDKNVYRLVRHKLRELAEREAAPARHRADAEALCERLEGLGRSQGWIRDAGILEHLDRQWSALEDQVTSELKLRYQAAYQVFDKGRKAVREQSRLASREEQDWLERGQQLLEQLSALESKDVEAELGQESQRLAEAWRELRDSAPGGAIEPDLETRVSAALQAADVRLRQLQDRQAEQQQRQALKRRVAAMLAATGPLDIREFEAVKRQGADFLAGTSNGAGEDGLRRDLEGLERRADKQRRKATERLAALPGGLTELQEALEQGVLQTATRLYQKLEKDIELIGKSAGQGAKLVSATKELRRLLPQLRELQRWRKWSVDEHRESLCQAMESLAEVADQTPEAMAERLQQLQQQWKQLDHSGSPGNRVLWERFHGAADRVFDHCRPYFDELARQRESNRQRKEALCAELEKFLNLADWERMDWKGALRAQREMRDVWQSIGPVESSRQRALDRRFRKAMQRLNLQLQQERQRNQALKRELIDEAGALAEEPDLDQAIQSAKQLQRRWHTTVAGKHKQENQLWQAFRGACDQVYDRQGEQRRVHRETLLENQRRREALCAEFEQLVGGEETDILALRQAFQQLEERWREAAEADIPQEARRELTRRWQQAGAGYQARLQEIERSQERGRLELLRQRAALCRELEQYLPDPEAVGPVLEQLRQRWQALPALQQADVQRRIEDRYQASCRALAERGDVLRALRAEADKVQDHRERLCLQLEILAGVQSPEAVAGQRMELQVERLSRRVRQGTEDAAVEPQAIEQEWYLLGPVPAKPGDELDQRCERALAELEG